MKVAVITAGTGSPSSAPGATSWAEARRADQ